MSRVGWELLPEAIAAAADWLMHSEQPAGAITHHLGESTYLGDGLSLKCAVGGWYRGPGGERGDATTARVHLNAWRAYEDGPNPAPFTESEIAEVDSILEANGLHVIDRWGTDDSDTFHHWRGWGVVCASPKSPSLIAAATKEAATCQTHNGVFCYWDDSCDDWRNRRALLVQPAWPSVPREPEEAPAAEPKHDDHNLEAVRRALKTITPLLAELDIHPATVVAGRRGDIEGEPGNLTFVDGAGHGVCFPAETAELLVRLAAERLLL